MKELFDQLPQTKMKSGIDYLVDTCFVYFIFMRHEKEFIHFCEEHIVGISSFNVEEVLYHSHDVNHHIRNRIRHAIKNGLNLYVVETPVHPGNPDSEKNFVSQVDESLLNLIPDPSDAVLAAVALKIHANIITRDKHHLFTTRLDNYFKKKDLSVLNNFPV